MFVHQQASTLEKQEATIAKQATTINQLSSTMNHQQELIQQLQTENQQGMNLRKYKRDPKHLITIYPESTKY